MCYSTIGDFDVNATVFVATRMMNTLWDLVLPENQKVARSKLVLIYRPNSQMSRNKTMARAQQIAQNRNKSINAKHGTKKSITEYRFICKTPKVKVLPLILQKVMNDLIIGFSEIGFKCQKVWKCEYTVIRPNACKMHSFGMMCAMLCSTSNSWYCCQPSSVFIKHSNFSVRAPFTSCTYSSHCISHCARFLEPPSTKMFVNKWRRTTLKHDE